MLGGHIQHFEGELLDVRAGDCELCCCGILRVMQDFFHQLCDTHAMEF